MSDALSSLDSCPFGETGPIQPSDDERTYVDPIFAEVGDYDAFGLFASRDHPGVDEAG